jgi:hypothetical protein
MRRYKGWMGRSVLQDINRMKNPCYLASDVTIIILDSDYSQLVDSCSSLHLRFFA